MSQTFASFDRQRADEREPVKGGFRRMAGFGLLLAGAIVVVAAAAGGAYYVGTLKPPATAPQAAAQPGQAAQPAAPALQWTTIGTFGSWEARCTTPPGQTAKVCTAVLQVINNQNKSVLMAWIVGPDDKGALQTIFQTPTGVNVGSGVDLKAGNAAARKIAFQACGPQQCTAAGPMNDAFIREVSGAERVNLTLTAANGQALNFGIPAAGLDKALAAIKK